MGGLYHGRAEPLGNDHDLPWNGFELYFAFHVEDSGWIIAHDDLCPVVLHVSVSDLLRYRDQRA